MTSGNSDVPIYNRDPEANIPSINDYFGIPYNSSNSFDRVVIREIKEKNEMINTNKSPANHPMRIDYAVI